MKTLLDEQMDIRMKGHLAGSDIYTLHDLGWLGLKNGELLDNMKAEGFELLITADKNLPFQQNLAALPFTLLLIDTPTLLFVHQVLFIPKIEGFLQNPPVPLPKIVHISVDGLSKGKKKEDLQKILPPGDLLLL